MGTRLTKPLTQNKELACESRHLERRHSGLVNGLGFCVPTSKPRTNGGNGNVMAGELEDARMPDEIEPSGMYEGQEHPEDGCVYFALCPYERAVKIGYTGYDDPWQRFNHLQATTAHWLCMLGWLPSGARQLERIVHQHFKEQRLYGEWFDFSDKWLRGEVGRMLGLDGVQCDDFWRVYHDR